jgi:cytochrome c
MQFNRSDFNQFNRNFTPDKLAWRCLVNLGFLFHLTMGELGMKAILVALVSVAGMASGSAWAADPVALAKEFKGDCLACHTIEKKMVGPAWKDVAIKYRGDKGAKEMLVNKVIKGGKGNWDKVTGGMAMPAHSSKPSKEEIGKIVEAILELK